MESPASPPIVGILLIALVMTGLLLRAYHYLRNPAVWHDEAAAIVNILSLNFGQLLGPLRHTQAAPPLFLWLEKATSLAFGDSTLALRLPAFLAGLPTVLLVAWVARREAGRWAALVATALIAGSDRLLWHACEVKPYSFDVLCSVGLLAAFSATRDWPIRRRLCAFLVLSPPVLAISYPGCFLWAGLLVAVLPAVRRDGRPGTWLAYATLAVVVAATAAVVYLGPARAQRTAAMTAYWNGQYPNWARPWTVPFWAVISTCEAARYCFMPCGYLLIGFAILGGVRLYRSGRGDFVILAVAPFALNFLAGCCHVYPFGGTRLVVHAAPALALLAGAGVESALARGLSTAAQLATAVLVALPLCISAYHVAVPWFRADSAAAVQYVLACRTTEDPVVANQVETEFYCRRIGHRFRDLPPDSRLPDERIWLILTAFDAKKRAAMFESLVGERTVVERREFAGVTVAHLEALSRQRLSGVDRASAAR